MLSKSYPAARLTLSILAAVFILSGKIGAEIRPGGQLYGLEASLTDLILRLSRSVVSVEVIAPGSSADPASPGGRASRLAASGVVADQSGGILIAASTVRPDAIYLISFESRTEPARLVGVDYVNELALLSVDSPLGVPVEFASTQVCAGQMILSIGNAFGFRACPSLGFCAGARPDGNLQFSMHSGFSSQGGGVFDLSGRLLGVLNGTTGQSQGMVGAAPAAQLGNLSQLLRAQGDRKAGYLGLASIDDLILSAAPKREVVPASALSGSNRPAAERAIVVTSVQPHSPAALAGVLPGDVITALNDSPLESSSELSLEIRQTRPGTPISLTVRRASGERRLAATVGCRSALRAAEMNPRSDTDSLQQILRHLQVELMRVQQQLNQRP